MKIKMILWLPVFVLAVASFNRRDIDNPPDGSLDFPKADIYALLGALGQRDWEFVLANSTTKFRDEINAGLIIQEKLVNNAELSNAVKKFVGKLPEEGEFSQDELLQILTDAVSEKDQFFVAGLNSIKTSGLPDYSLRVPSRIVGSAFDDSHGSLSVYYQALTESAVDFNAKLRFEKPNGKWKLASRATPD